MYISKITAFAIIIIVIALCDCSPKPPSDTQDMKITRMTKVYYYAFIKPRVIGVLDQGDIVKTIPTKDGWYEIWRKHKGKWKTGYVEYFCLKEYLNR